MWYLAIALLIAPTLGGRLPGARMGFFSKEGYIVGGTEVSPVGKYPWQAALRFNGGHYCGASVISNSWVVTAGHCVQQPMDTYEIVVGQHDQSGNQGAQAFVGLTSINVHPDYTGSGNDGFPADIAVVNTNTFEYNDFVGPATMAESFDDFVGQDCVISGWGQTGGYGTIPENLQEATTTVISQADCANRLEDEFSTIIRDDHVCLLSDTLLRGSCSGDSGGPLICDGLLAGATSWGISNIFSGECLTEYPSVYASVGYYRDWIGSITGV